MLVFIFLILLTACARPEVSSFKDPLKINIPSENESIDAAVDDKGNTYAVNQNKVMVFNSKGKLASTMNLDIECGTEITIGNGLIYILDDKSKSVKSFDMKGRFVDEYPVDVSWSLKIEVVKNKLFLLQAEKGNLYKTHMTIIDLKTKSTDKFDMDEMRAISQYKDNLLMIAKVTSDGTHFITYDYEKKVKKDEYRYNIWIDDFDYSPKDKAIYYVEGIDIKKLDLEKKKIENVFAVSAYSLDPEGKKIYRFTRLVCDHDSCCILNTQNKTIYRVSKDNYLINADRVLNITSAMPSGLENDYRFYCASHAFNSYVTGIPYTLPLYVWFLYIPSYMSFILSAISG